MLLLSARYCRSSSQHLADTRTCVVSSLRSLCLSVDFFAVRTMTEVSILTCSRTEDKRAFVQHCMKLPLPSAGHMKSKYVADTAFNSSGSQIATVTDRGFWSVYGLSIPAKTVSVAASGWLELPELSAGENRTGWWKIEWIQEPNNLVVAESKGLHLLNFNVPSVIELN